MGSSLSRLVQLCAASNRIPWWTQGAGSNISVKDGDTLRIKASGKRLSQVRDASDVAVLALGALREELSLLRFNPPLPSEADRLYRASLQRHLRPTSPSPSMETGMHVLLPGSEVVHLHSLVAIALAEQIRRGDGAVDSFLRKAALRMVWVPSTLPGWSLAEGVASSGSAEVLLLANHGLILQGADAHALLSAWSEVEAAWCAQFDAGGLSLRVANAHAMHESWLFAPARAVPTLPDVAVFLDEVLAVTEPVDAHARESRRLRASGIDRSASAVELWAAHVALAHMAPSLPPLSSDYVQQVSGLPQEQLRRARLARDSSQ